MRAISDIVFKSVWFKSRTVSIFPFLPGGLSYAELGTLLPVSGGGYSYVRAGGKPLGRLGDVASFLYSWSFVTFADPMAASLQGFTFASYALRISYQTCSPPHSAIVLVSLVFIREPTNL